MTLMKDDQEGQLECALWPIVQVLVRNSTRGS